MKQIKTYKRNIIISLISLHNCFLSNVALFIFHLLIPEDPQNFFNRILSRYEILFNFVIQTFLFNVAVNCGEMEGLKKNGLWWMNAIIVVHVRSWFRHNLNYGLIKKVFKWLWMMTFFYTLSLCENYHLLTSKMKGERKMKK